MAFTLRSPQNSEYLQDEQFYVYVSSNPNITREDARVIDEIRWFLQSQDAINLIACFDDKLHKEEGDPKANETYCGNARVNKRPCKLIYPNMSASQLRYFVRKIENIHPEIKQLVSTHEMHLPISPSVATLAMFSSDASSTDLINLTKTHNFTSKDGFVDLVYDTNANIPAVASLSILQQQYPQVNEWVDKLNASANDLYVQSLPDKTYGKVKTEYNSGEAHGLLLGNDTLKASRVSGAVNSILENAYNRYKDRYRLMDHLVPLVSRYEPGKATLFYKFDIEGIQTEMDPNGTKKNSNNVPNKILYAYIERFNDDNVNGKYIQS